MKNFSATDAASGEPVPRFEGDTMRLKLLPGLISAALLAAALPLASQVVPSATEGSLPFAVGAGASSYDVDWAHGRMLGGTLWIDWRPSRIPPLLRGLGLEVEARDISLNHSSTQPANLRQDTAGGGLIYAWPPRRRFHLYGKGLMSLGSFDYAIGQHNAHSSMTVIAPGLGLEGRVYRHVWVRADYEYQHWSQLGGFTPNPQGFTLGALYNFRNFHRH
jgi:opacity protein-like surface antigen